MTNSRHRRRGHQTPGSRDNADLGFPCFADAASFCIYRMFNVAARHKSSFRTLVGSNLAQTEAAHLPQLSQPVSRAQIATRGRMAWQKATGYNQRSRGTTHMGRWKAVIGPKLKARAFENQRAEAKIGVRVLRVRTH